MKNLNLIDKKKIINELKDIGVKNLVISGGEPLLSKDCITLIDYSDSLGFNVYLQTNGSLINDAFISKTKGKLKGIQISLEGLKEIHNKITKSNSFDIIINNIKKLKINKFFIMTNFTITSFNLTEIEEYVKLIDDLEVDLANFTRLYPSGLGKENFKELMVSKEDYEKFIIKLNSLESKVKLRIAGPTPLCLLEKCSNKLEFALCSAGREEFAINPNGDVLICPSWPVSLGNALNKDIKEILNSSGFIRIKNREFLNNDCKTKCEKFSVCGGGCLIHAMNKERKDVYAENILIRTQGSDTS